MGNHWPILYAVAEDFKINCGIFDVNKLIGTTHSPIVNRDQISIRGPRGQLDALKCSIRGPTAPLVTPNECFPHGTPFPNVLGSMRGCSRETGHMYILYADYHGRMMRGKYHGITEGEKLTFLRENEWRSPERTIAGSWEEKSLYQG